MNTSCVDNIKTASAYRQIHVHQREHVNTNNKTDLQIQILTGYTYRKSNEMAS